MGESFDDILAAAQVGSAWALERLYLWLAPAVAGYLRVQGASEPDDQTSDVFFNAFSRIGSFSGGESEFRSWIFTIAHNALVDERRRRDRRPELVETDTVPELEAPGGDAGDEALRRMSFQRVQDLCQSLSPDQRDVVLLRIVADMSIDQTAEALGKSPGAVKVLQHRAITSLRRNFDNKGVTL